MGTVGRALEGIVGYINLGNRVVVADPSYGTNIWCSGVLENVLTGKYQCEVIMSDDKSDRRVASIVAKHIDYLNVEPYELQPFEVCVDSGQAGIYDAEYHAKYHNSDAEWSPVNDDWYDRVCELTGAYVLNDKYREFESSKCFDISFIPFILGEHIFGSSDIDTIIDKYSSMDSSLLNKGENDVIKEFLSLSDSEKYSIYARYLRALYDYSMSFESHKSKYVNTGGVLDEKCFISSSGYGKGGYICFVGRNSKGKIVSISINYLLDCNDYDCDVAYYENGYGE